MKRILLVLFLLYFNSSFSQTLPDYDKIKLEQKSEFKNAEESVMKAANYVLSTPFEEKDLDRLKSLQFIVKWMSGTPDYSFMVDNTATSISEGNNEIFGLYMVCMVKYSLENPSSASDVKLVKLNTIKLLLAYCENADNNIKKMTKQLKKFSKANKKGELEKEIEKSND